MNPGSAAHHGASHSASKTRVNALMALRSIRGTHPFDANRLALGNESAIPIRAEASSWVRLRKPDETESDRANQTKTNKTVITSPRVGYR
jgi:hypothetical protein